ncbi:MAG: S-layer homology domain-containing protein [Acidimicrobiia bacterium]|nr:S-layer homology domain-containing protein [Acidimicrobiia bacterium]
MRWPRFRRSIIGAVVLAVVVAVPAAAALSRFLDVPDDSPFLADIEWLADSGVTNGCGTDVFCPDGSVNRAQMAAFLHRLAENEVVKAASALTADAALTADTAVTADHAATADSATTALAAATAATAASASDSAALDGRLPETYDTFVIGDARHAGDMAGYLTICSIIQEPFCPTSSLEGVLVAEAMFTTVAPDSFVAATGMTSLSWIAGTAPFPTWVWLQLDSSDCFDSINGGPTAAYVRQNLSPGSHEAITVTVSFEIPDPGAHSIALCAQPFDGVAGVLASTISGVVSASPNNVTSQTFFAP